MKTLLLFILSCSIVSAAITERYVSPAGSGAADGTSAGAAMSLTTFIDYMTTGGSFTAAAGDRFNLLAGTYARTTNADTWVNGGSATSPVIVQGYGSTITDGYQGRTAGGALVTTNFAAFTWTGGTAKVNVTGSFFIFQACSFESAANSDTVLFNTGDSNVFQNCKVTNSGTGGSAGCIALNTNSIAFDCDFEMTASGGGLRAVNTSSGVFDSCRARVNASQTIPVYASGSNGTGLVLFCVAYAGGGVGIANTSTSSGSYYRSNTIVANGGDGIDIITGSTKLQRIVGNMITDNTGYGIDMVSTANAGFLAYNRTRDNTAGAINSGTDWVTATSIGHVTTDSGDGTTDYNNFSGNDYRLKSTSAATSAGRPELMSIGAAQRDQTGSGAGATAHTFVQ